MTPKRHGHLGTRASLALRKRVGVLASVARARANLLRLIAVAVTLVLVTDIIDLSGASVLVLSASILLVQSTLE